MAPLRQIRPGYAVIHPNRDRAGCKVTRLLVVVVMLVSVGLVLAVTIGGWSQLEGMTPVNFIWCAIYLVLAFYIARWARGMLPITAVLAVLLLAIAAVAALGLGGTSWFQRAHPAYAHARALGGGTGFSADLLGTLVLLLIPVELLLAAIAMFAFSQQWNVELEVPQEEADRRGSRPIARGPQPRAT